MQYRDPVRLLGAVLIAAPVLGALAPSLPQEAATAEAVEGDLLVDAAISAEELKAHVRWFSSDELKGRPMGSPESLRTAVYSAARLKAAGFEPGAADGTFLQTIGFGRSTYTEAPELVVTLGDGSEERLYFGADFSFQSAIFAKETAVLRCVLVGAEEDVPDKADQGVALILATSRMRASAWLEAKGHGRRGAGFGLVVVPKKAKAREKRVPVPSPMRPITSEIGTVEVSTRGDWSERFKSGEVTSVQFLPHAEFERQADANVCAVLPGVGTEANPELAKEVVILSAHRDHVGVDRRVAESDPEADSIRNGADDDASGCAVVLEVAEAIAAGERPARTVMVLLDTGEEAGFVGSTHWTKNPTVPIESVVCALNFEMLGRPDEAAGGAGGVWLTGDERSTLGPGLRERGVEISADGRLQHSFFTRSDNVPLAKVGIVAQTLSSYNMHRDYHAVTDEWDRLDYAHMEQASARCLAVARSLAAGDWKPVWNEGEPKF